MRIGIVGYSAAKFDLQSARILVNLGLGYYDVWASEIMPGEREIVSGLTNLGIPALAYAYAKKKGLRTVGIACAKAREYECFPVDKEIIVGSDWGDESDTFLNYIDCLVRVGGGKQSLAEVQAFKKLKPNASVFELELPETQ